MLLRNKKAQVVPSAIDPSALMKGAGIIGKSAGSLSPLAGSASKAIGAATNIGGGLLSGLGFGVGGKLTDIASKSAMGLKPLLLAIAFDAFAYFTGEVNPFFGIFFHIVVAWILLTKYIPGDKFLRVLLMSKISVLIYILLVGYFPAILQQFPEVHRWIFLTVGNHAFPVATMYIIFTGFISNRTGGILVQLLYAAAFFALIFFAYDKAQDEVNDIFMKAGIDIKATLPAEQKTVFTTFAQDLIQSTKTTGGKFLMALRNSPQAIANFINPKLKAAGGEALFGKEKEEQPKLGIVLASHPSGATKAGEKTIVKALITIPNPLEDRSFLTVTKIKCYNTQSRTDFEVEGTVLEYPQEALQKGLNVFYNRPATVSCEFKTEELAEASTVKFAVSYEFSSNAKLITYVMKDDLLEDLLVRNEDPLDYMAVPPNKRKPSTKFDNGPARFGIGPVELNNPPLGIKNGKTYPGFELVIGNKNADFNGVISKVNNILITLPSGFSLKESDTCAFKSEGGGKYSINEKAMEEKLKDFTNIKSSRLFTCPMEVKTEDALGTASFSQVEFNADVDFTYEAEIDVSTKPRS